MAQSQSPPPPGEPWPISDEEYEELTRNAGGLPRGTRPPPRSPRTVAQDRLLVQAILSCRPQSPPWREEAKSPDHIDEAHTELDEDEERSSDDLAAYQPIPSLHAPQAFSQRPGAHQVVSQQSSTQQGVVQQPAIVTTSTHQVSASAPQTATDNHHRSRRLGWQGWVSPIDTCHRPDS